MQTYFVIWSLTVLFIFLLGNYAIPKSRSSVKKVFYDDDDSLEAEKYIEAKRKSGIEERREFLAQSKTGISFEFYIVLHVIAIAICFVVGYLIFRQPIVALFISLLGIPMPKKYVQFKRNQILLNFDKNLILVLDRMISLLRNRPIATVFDEIASSPDVDPFIRSEFSEMLVDLKSNKSIEEAIYGCYQRVGSHALKIMYIQIKLDRDIGLSLPDLFRSVRDSIVRKIQEDEDANIQTAQQQQTANMLIFIVVCVVGFLFLYAPETYMYMLNTVLGRLLIATMITMIGVGVFFIQKIIKS